MAKISVIGICGNSVFMQVDHFHERGETLCADSVYEEIGGKGINQTIAARRMGAEVSFLCAVGDDENGRKCIKEIEKNRVNTHLKIKENKATPLAFILTDKFGENRVTVHKSAQLCPEDVISFESEIASSDILLLQNEVPEEVNEKAAELAKRHGVKVILNPAPMRQISDTLRENVDIVTPNEQEAKGIDGANFESCITTLGSRGCLINGRTAIPSISVKAVNTTGAGDTFNGVLAVCIAEGMDMERAVKYAVCAAGISVTRSYVINAIPKREEIERILISYEKSKGGK